MDDEKNTSSNELLCIPSKSLLTLIYKYKHLFEFRFTNTASILIWLDSPRVIKMCLDSWIKFIHDTWMRSNVDRESHKKKTKSKEEDIIFPYHGFRFWTQYYFFFCSKDTILLYSTFLMFRHRIVFSYNRKGNITNNRVKTKKNEYVCSW